MSCRSSSRCDCTTRSAASGASPSAAAASSDFSSLIGSRKPSPVARRHASRRCGRDSAPQGTRLPSCCIPSALRRRPALAPSHRRRSRWLVTTNDARLALRYGSYLSPFSLRQRERRAYRDLLVLLASELFRRERGAPPPNDEALVGTYLESLP